MSHSNERLKSAQINNDQNRTDSATIPKPPRGKQRLQWVGPGFVFIAASAGGAGEILFPPRIGSLYGYVFIWAMLTAVTLKWFVNREIGRFAVCTGATLLDGFKQLPGPQNWAVWLIIFPQFFVAVGSIAGLAGAAATAIVLLLPGDPRFWMIMVVISTMAILLWGRYGWLEKISTVLAALLISAAIITAITVFPEFGSLAAGLVPSVPSDVDYSEILPWLSFMLAGAAGLMWYSYWIPERGYGAAEQARENDTVVRPAELTQQERNRLKGWVSQMTLDNTVGIVGGLLNVTAFLILGAELLGPEGLVPAENDVAEVLGRLLGEVWGPVGFWFMIIAVFIGFWQTTLTNQDGWSRLLADGSGIILRRFQVRGRWANEKFLQKVFLIVLLTGVTSVLYLFIGKPVRLLQLAGAIEAAHIPVVVGLTLYLNHTVLPKDLRPSATSFWATVLAGVFFAVFAVIYLLQTTGVIWSSSGSAA
ncbi:Nramp family divalent metal transporter [Romeria aff. gracilis LEGE 07310]|uniref:Nramp family divalent metal transporter n=1 Tax=Vasconcelosia minhoensis LEGE 07310 TaxID=915328 RepID=A0A8J7A9T3_9CYAN|nr:Nramp family divalent metal transporter [Romeria gracilis]MBE9079982.1 Nramp family divalent metal transporter [Romeria aff. gracilis LEGE 07310]